MTISVTWHPRMIPLAPVAMAAQGDSARQLAQRLLIREDETLALLRGVSGQGLLVILGEETRLPWVDGAIYLGHHADAPTLLLPTTLEPSVPLALWERALQRHVPDLAPPIAALPGTHTLLSLAAARPIARETLLRWLEDPR